MEGEARELRAGFKGMDRAQSSVLGAETSRLLENSAKESGNRKLGKLLAKELVCKAKEVEGGRQLEVIIIVLTVLARETIKLDQDILSEIEEITSLLAKLREIPGYKQEEWVTAKFSDLPHYMDKRASYHFKADGNAAKGRNKISEAVWDFRRNAPGLDRLLIRGIVPCQHLKSGKNRCMGAAKVLISAHHTQRSARSYVHAIQKLFFLKGCPSMVWSEGKHIKRNIPILHGLFYIFYVLASVYEFFWVLKSNPARRDNQFETFFEPLQLFAVIVFTAASHLKFFASTELDIADVLNGEYKSSKEKTASRMLGCSSPEEVKLYALAGWVDRVKFSEENTYYLPDYLRAVDGVELDGGISVFIAMKLEIIKYVGVDRYRGPGLTRTGEVHLRGQQRDLNIYSRDKLMGGNIGENMTNATSDTVLEFDEEKI